MESFGTITYSGSQFGELRSCLDSTPFSKRRPASADSHATRRHAAWPGSRPVSAVAQVASTVDVVYSSAADMLTPPPPTLVAFDNAPLRPPMSGGHLPGGGNVPALAIPVRASRPATATITRRQATSVLAPRNRPSSAAEIRTRASAGAASSLVGKVATPSANLKRHQSAAALLSGTLQISNKQQSSPPPPPRQANDW